MTTSRNLLLGLLGAGCLTASGVGGYFAVRSGGMDAVSPPAEASTSASGEALEARLPTAIEAAAVEPTPGPSIVAPLPAQPASRRAAPEREPVTRRRAETSIVAPAARAVLEEPPAESAVDPTPELPTAPVDGSVIGVIPAAAGPGTLARPAETLTIERDAVIGIRLATAVSSETARIEDLVTARVTRDVRVDGITVIPAGARVEGTVTVVEPGGKFRDRARIGVQFTSVVLDDAAHIPIETEAIFRDGEAPAGEATSKIGASAVVGTILGAVIGGKKGAAIGGTAGAAGGTAAVMAGGRNPAVIAEGTNLTVRLIEPLSVTITPEP